MRIFRDPRICAIAVGLVVLAVVQVGLWRPWREPVVEAAPPALVAEALLGAPASNEGPRQAIIDGSLQALGDHEYSDLGSVTNFTDGGTYTIPAGAHLAFISVYTANIRWRCTGDDPAAATGHQLVAAGTMWYNGPLRTFECIDEGGGATMHVTFFGR